MIFLGPLFIQTQDICDIFGATQSIKQTQVDQAGRSAIFDAIERNQDETVAMLLCAGAKFDFHDLYYNYPIHLAVKNSNDAITTMLIECGASVNVFNAEGQTPLMFAMDRNEARLVRKILMEYWLHFVVEIKIVLFLQMLSCSFSIYA